MAKISRIAVLGDSVAWGQGLLTPRKYANLVAASVGLQPLGIDLMRAHSGAIIGISDPASVSASDGEIPAPAPLIVDQINAVSQPDTIDLVLVSAGINDVGVQNIVNPATAMSDLENWTTTYCHQDMQNLLRKVLGAFKNASVRVTGYYPIISPASDPFAAAEVDLLSHLLGNFNVGFPKTLDRGPILDAVTARTMRFWRDSTDCLQRAVSEITGGYNDRAVFVPAPFTEDNALFAPNPSLWGFAPDLGPEDEVSAQRGKACDLMYGNPVELVQNEICHHASVGHPNVSGAKAIAEAILGTL